MTASDSAQRLLALLPAIYREDEFVGRYLRAFEQVLLGFESRIDGIASLFDPVRTDAKFLPWLASWIAFTLHADLDPAQQGEFLQNVVPLYRRRGTKDNLQRLLSIFVGSDEPPTIEEDPTRPHFFRVTVALQARTVADRRHQGAVARALVELERPAHTVYELNIEFPGMQIGDASTVGVDTLLGTHPRFRAR